MDFKTQGVSNAAMAECVATPNDLVRTAMRILIIHLHRGLGSSSVQLRQSPEAQKASQALYAAGEFFNQKFDPARLDVELQRLSAALVPLAMQHGCDPFGLYLFATGEIRQRLIRYALHRIPRK